MCRRSAPTRIPPPPMRARRPRARRRCSPRRPPPTSFARRSSSGRTTASSTGSPRSRASRRRCRSSAAGIRASSRCSPATSPRRSRPRATHELGGPEIFSFRELMDYILKTIERRRVLLPLPFWLAKFQASFLQYLPKPLLTPDQVELLRTDNVVSPQAIDEQRTLQGLGIEPRLVQAIVPSYLWRFRRTGQFKTARHG